MGESNVGLSIVIPCYNRGERLQKALSAILPSCDGRIEIVLTDDSDDSVSSKILSDFSRSFPETVLYNKNKDRLGYADNLIKGVHLSSGGYLFFLLDEDSLVVDKFNNFISGIYSNNYKIAISDCTVDVGRKTSKLFKKIQDVEIAGELRHLSGLVLSRSLACEAIANSYVIEAINKAPQYPQIPIGLYCASKFNVYKYVFPVYKVGTDGISGSDWTKTRVLSGFSMLSSRANQIESWLVMMNSLISSDKSNKLRLAFKIKKALEEYIYILIEQGVVTTFDRDTSFVFYRRSAINSLRWLVSNKMIGKFIGYFFKYKRVK